jgi:D-beta-D-heptose 7-phosphate kinase/D-beta-D-heptose 1-phosphate adenosyltransferase
MIEKIRNRQPHIAVIGDIMLDHYIFGRCERISPEAPVPVFDTQTEKSLLGGAGNVLSNLLSLEANATLFSVLGKDDNALLIKKALNKLPFHHNFILYEDNRISTKKTRIIASHQQMIRLDEESTHSIKKGTENVLLHQLKESIHLYDVILLSDYGKGLLSTTLTQSIIKLAKSYDIPILVDPKGENYNKYTGATLLTPNKKEALLALKIPIDSQENLSTALYTFKKRYQLKYALITLSEEGIALLDKKVEIIPTVAKEVFDVTGAGDTVIASLSVAIASGLSIQEACQFSNQAAAVVVAKVGSATTTLHEISLYTHTLSKGRAESKYKQLSELKSIVSHLQLEGKRIVFTNGCFDILHRGHASYLEKAKQLGDILIVGINADESIQKLKGENRPINTLEDRAFLIASLESVDFVIDFEEETPYRLIQSLHPDILVKGADYQNKEVIGSDLVKEVVLIDFVEGKSTTKIIEKIIKPCID